MSISTVRAFLAIVSCKASRAALRLLKRGGTAFPGKAAMFWSPEILADVSKGVTTIIVTGTNGKTTTCRILEHALLAAGKEPLANRSGANLLSGITAEFVCSASVKGQAGYRYAVIECDEAALRHVAPLVKPAVIVVTNLFRDQLDRYGEVMHTLEVIREAVREVPETVLCLNADDSLTASLGLDVPGEVRYYGMDAPVDIAPKSDPGAPAISDARHCIRCGAKYRYRYHTYAHLGGFYCPSCGYERPAADVAVTSVDRLAEDSSTVHLRVGETVSKIGIGLPAVYNLYNAAAAVCAYTAAGFPASEILGTIGDHVGGFGRQEQFVLDGVPVRMILVKNPAGCNQTLEFLGTMEQDFDLILCLNDRTADGHDISWIWDADYEKLAGISHLDRICVYGDRAEDLRVRLKYAGIETDRISLASDEKEILSRIREGTKPVVILPNYTSMLAVRAALSKEAGAGEFWKG